MPEDDEPEVVFDGATNTLQLTRSEHYRTLYTNAAKLGLSSWDIRISFASIIEAEPDKFVNEEQVTVIMSPQHAKELLRVFIVNLAQWEKQYGEIAIPSGFSLNPIGKAAQPVDTPPVPDATVKE